MFLHRTKQMVLPPWQSKEPLIGPTWHIKFLQCTCGFQCTYGIISYKSRQSCPPGNSEKQVVQTKGSMRQGPKSILNTRVPIARISPLGSLVLSRPEPHTKLVQFRGSGYVFKERSLWSKWAKLAHLAFYIYWYHSWLPYMHGLSLDLVQKSFWGTCNTQILICRVLFMTHMIAQVGNIGTSWVKETFCCSVYVLS